MGRENNKELPPFWRKDGTKFVNDFTKQSTKQRPSPLLGGIFNDSKGLDMIKPLLYLVLIDNLLAGNCDCNPTLILYPEDEQVWRVLFNKQVKGKNFMDENGIVISDYDSFIECFNDIRNENFRRIIVTDHRMTPSVDLQEHVRMLNADVKWVVTVKPIRFPSVLNSIFRMFNVEPFCNDHNLMQQYIDEHHSSFEKLFMSEGEFITLRRTLVQLGLLPEIDITNHFVQLSDKDQNTHNMMLEEADVMFMRYNKNKAKLGPMLLPIVEALFASCRLISTHPSLCHTRLNLKTFEDLSKNPVLMARFGAALQGDGFQDCSICTSKLSGHSLVTMCCHVFCQKCIRKHLPQDPRCPNCREVLSEETDLFSCVVPPRETKSSKVLDLLSTNKAEDVVPPHETESSKVPDSSSTNKVDVLLTLLKEQQSKQASANSVVFSQYNMMLSLLEKALNEEGFKTLCLYDTTSDKDSVIKKFNSVLWKDRPMVLLVSIGAEIETKREQIVLKAASNVYLMEALKKRAEKWAVKCIQLGQKELGQKEPVKVFRIIAKNTIEEKILELHEKRIEPSVNPEVTCCADAIDVNEMSFLFNG